VRGRWGDKELDEQSEEIPRIRRSNEVPRSGKGLPVTGNRKNIRNIRQGL
jgi:hypothetical protein